MDKMGRGGLVFKWALRLLVFSINHVPYNKVSLWSSAQKIALPIHVHEHAFVHLCTV